MEAIFSCAAVPDGNPHPKRVAKLKWTAEVWNVSSGVASCLGALDDITAQAEIEKLKEKTRKCEGDYQIKWISLYTTNNAQLKQIERKNPSKLSAVPPPSTPGPLRDIWKQVLAPIWPYADEVHADEGHVVATH